MRGTTSHARKALTGTALLLAGAVAAGCMGPTYGTDKPTGQQLVEDVTGVLALAPREREQINYTPRPGLVRPSNTDSLPAPQVAATESGDGAWPESPEQRRERLRQEATENQDNPFYRSPIVGDSGLDRDWSQATPEEQRAEMERRREINRQGSAQARRLLSDPPLEYRVPSETAPVDDLGEDEWRKERQAQRRSSGRGWRDFIPWL